MQKRYRDDLPALLDDYELDAEEREAILAGDIGKLYVLGANGQLLMHFAALLGMPWADYIEAMREGVRRHGPVRAGIYAMTTSTDEKVAGVWRQPCTARRAARHRRRRAWRVRGRRSPSSPGCASAFSAGTAPDAPTQRTAIDPFRQALRDLGYVEGQNLEIHYRWAEGRPERLPALVAELLKLDPDVVVAMGPRPAFAAKAATTTVPVIAAAVDNPVVMGLVPDFSRPGGNMHRDQLVRQRAGRPSACSCSRSSCRRRRDRVLMNPDNP